MKRKVKKGSALVTVMLFSILFLAMSSVSVLAVVNTMRGNSGESLYQSLYYEAEAGIEKAMAKINTGAYDDDAIWPMESNLPTMTFNLNISQVTVNIKKTGDKDGVGNYINEYYKVKSTSKSGNNSRTIEAKLKRHIDAVDLFRYSICGQGVNVNGTGSINVNPSLINSSDSPANVGASGSLDPGSETNDPFTLPMFDDSKIPKHSGELEIVSSDFKAELDNLSVFSTSCVRKVYLNNADFTVYLINADKIKITTGGFNYERIMIITQGELIFNLTGPGQLNKSSLVAKSVDVGDANLQISNRPFNENNPDGVLMDHEPLNTNDIEKLMNGYVDGGITEVGISYYIPNFGFGGGPSGSIIPAVPSDYE